MQLPNANEYDLPRTGFDYVLVLFFTLTGAPFALLGGFLYKLLFGKPVDEDDILFLLILGAIAGVVLGISLLAFSRVVCYEVVPGDESQLFDLVKALGHAGYRVRTLANSDKSLRFEPPKAEGNDWDGIGIYRSDGRLVVAGSWLQMVNVMNKLPSKTGVRRMR